VIFIPSSHLDEPEHVKRSIYAPPVGSIAWQLDAVARRDERIAELNAPPTPSPESTVGDTAPEVPAVKVTKTQRAAEWLARVLHDGPVPQRTVEALAVKDGIGTKPLKLAKGKLKVQSVRKGRNHWAWQLPMAKRPKDGRE
jgi:hypothetical protein